MATENSAGRGQPVGAGHALDWTRPGESCIELPIESHTMQPYPFTLVQYERPGPIQDNSVLTRRPFAAIDHSFAADARRFVPGKRLETAINTAIAVGEPLLITGEPGTGKTQAAYYAAYKLDVEPVIHFQVKSETVARDLLYHFDTIRYFHDAHMGGGPGHDGTPGDKTLDKGDYIEKRALWLAFERAGETGAPPVVLIDEIDKAPRDFPNDLLHELDKMAFTVMETDETIEAPRALGPIVFITSNSERRLPEPFLRRCTYHHIEFTDERVKLAVQARKDDFKALSPEFIALAVRRFLALRDRNLRKVPATGELLVWLRVLASAVGAYPETLEEDLSKLPYLGVLLKDHQDMVEL
uniref:AAA domain (Dynein-related subfamily) n=1 Tax=Candidatus Kentrum eta TaxID=2126337 RepID=A0A450V2D9_9GAMM|nr:MAG: AAA domain (dynein-related subfamily) [Candidatus Kentron sp. H]VFJ92390.1 MAG: AAA domain (dynein-related subfamily) [Candidatus Kentron sp. H]VFJ98980.1 MAG: AAA domain (dynein-related subfamily) [Candidatus Kentron sp. H]